MLGQSLKRAFTARPARLSGLRSNTVRLGGLRWQSTEAEGTPVTATNRAEATQRRFWKDVGIERRGDAYTVTLDKRALKTPAGKTLLLPLNKVVAATLIAAEWDHQETLLKPHALPMTSIVSRAVDAMTDETIRQEVREALLKYFETDTICFFHDRPDSLVRLQAKHWTPLLDWARETFGVEIVVSNSVLPAAQPKVTIDKLRKVIEQFDEWELAAFERAVYSSKSFIIALALVKGHLGVEEASLASSVEVDAQIEKWGEVEDTHDVDYQDIRRHLGSVACVLSTV